MRVVAAIAILIIGGALGYGWHEVSPRVLGSQPFCGPKYPGMLRAIPEDEFFPRAYRFEVDPEFEDEEERRWVEEGVAYERDPFVAGLRHVGEPSFWRGEQSSEEAVRFIFINDLHYIVVRVELTSNGGEMSATVFHTSHFEPPLIREQNSFELTEEQAEQIRELVQIDDLRDTCIWEPYADLSEELNADWDQEQSVFLLHPKYTLVEAVRDGEYVVVERLALSPDSRIRTIALSLTRISGLPTYSDYFDDDD